MPGRGTYWRKGGLNDGVILPEDLDVTVQAGHTVQDEGSNLADRTNLNFAGAGVTATDDSGNDATLVTIPGGGGSGFDPYATEPNDYIYFYDEFFYPSPNPTSDNWHWERAGTGTPSLTVPTSQVGGKIDQSTSSNSGDSAIIRTCAGGLVAVDIAKKFKVVWVVQNATSVANSAERIGLFAEGNAPSGTYPFSSEANPYIWFAHDGSGNYLAETHDGSTPVSTDTGVAVDLLPHTFEISFDPSGTPTLTFKIDGTTVHTQTANLPNGNLSVGTAIQTGTTATRTQRIDTALIVNDR